ncbi:LapA family protein [Hyphococcus sp.]|uniref:LapA family protein n=1 Tax=Hyphococcus sp. TaxID=2038636 RepID=UPI0037512A49
MSKWLFRIIWIPILAGAVLFLVANRTPVAISLDPFRPENPAMSTPSLPLWFWLMAMLFIGLGLGVAGSWLSGREARGQARDNRRMVKALQKEVTALSARLPEQPSPDEDLPKLESANL